MSDKVNDLNDLHKLVPGSEPPKDEPDSGKEPDRATQMVTLDIRLETKGRKGKGMTVISGFHHHKQHLEKIAKELKATCGAGGTVKRDAIEIQGDHREKVAQHLEKKGFKTKVIKR
ncbi:MAG: stress response translation initiation inhibitor YciH [Ectothiorhodospiraceae bacterium]|nr:stress response translation initiation inhibitor YciH [Ectothiorhodospiraceae bacterium]